MRQLSVGTLMGSMCSLVRANGADHYAAARMGEPDETHASIDVATRGLILDALEQSGLTVRAVLLTRVKRSPQGFPRTSEAEVLDLLYLLGPTFTD